MELAGVAICNFLVLAVAQPLLRAEVRVTATVADGVPVRAQIDLSAPGIRFHARRLTDGDGVAAFRDLAAGEYRLEVFDPGVWEPQRQSIRLAADEGVEVPLALAPVVQVERIDPEWSGFWQVRHLWSSGRGGGGELVITAFKDGPARLTFSLPGRPVGEESRLELSGRERDEIRSLLRQAELFAGHHLGTDSRAGDGPFNTLTVRNGAVTAVLVTSGNSSFRIGARGTLLATLVELRQRFGDRR